MVQKENMTIGVDKKLYEDYLKLCKEQGWVLKRRIENFIKGEVEIFSATPLDDGNNKKLTDKETYGTEVSKR